MLGLVVMIATVVISVHGRPRLPQAASGAPPSLFYLTIASLIMPSILISLGVGLMFQHRRPATRIGSTSAFGAHLTWTLPFGLLIMFAVFNRFDKAYEEAARDLGATSWQTFRYVVLPIIAPSLIGVACSASRSPTTSSPARCSRQAPTTRCRSRSTA